MLEFIIMDFSKQISELQNNVQAFAKENKLPFIIKKNDDSRINIVFVGEYSVGKSTILKMLTNDQSIKTGAQRTTDKVTKYHWNEIIDVIDTPGINANRPDHDDLAYSAINSADLLVFVITESLFNPLCLEDFRRLAIDKDKASEMILVVNKMCIGGESNTPEQQQILTDNLREVLKPYSPEDFYICFLDAESFIDSLNTNPPVSEDLLARSGYNQFVNTLNKFASDKKTAGKLTTRLYDIEDQLEAISKRIKPETEDEDIKALIQNLRKERHTLFDARARLCSEIEGIFSIAAATIRTNGSDAANLLVEGAKLEEIEPELEKIIYKSNTLISQCQQEAIKTLDERFIEIDCTMQNIEDSPSVQILKANLQQRYNELPNYVKKIITGTEKGIQKASETIIKNAYNSDSQNGLELINFTDSKVHDIILKIGDTVGYKFKPWQSEKWTRNVVITGQVFRILGVVFTFSMQFKEDRDQDKRREELKNNRQNIRSQFNAAASGLEEYGRQFVDKYIIEQLGELIQRKEDKIHNLQNEQKAQNDICEKLENYQNECRRLYRAIHKTIEQE